MTIHHQNWSGHTVFHAVRFHEPTTVVELQDVVRKADRVRVMGSRHCFNDIADTTGDLVSLNKLGNAATIDAVNHTVTLNAGMTYRELCPQLHASGYALPNMASLDHLTVVGACMTATHGSGDALGNLATVVSGVEMVTASGELVTLTRVRDGDRFLGAVVALGALGVVTKVTLDLVPAFVLRQDAYQNLPFRNIHTAFDEIMSAGYSVSLFPTWQSNVVDSVWVKQKVVEGEAVDVPDTFFDATRIPNGHLFGDATDRIFTPMGTSGPWFERLPHFTFKDAHQVGDELQSEYFVPRHHAPAALDAVTGLGELLSPILSVSEIRSVAADKLWLSSAYEQDVVGIHFNWRKDWAGVKSFLPVLEEHLAPFEPRPHWGKLFMMSPDHVREAYPRMGDFQALVREFDPHGKFRNAYVEKYIGCGG